MNCGLPTESIEKIRDVFARHTEVTSVTLYGSRAKGNYKNGSDIDLTLKGGELDLNILNRIDNKIDDLLLPWTFDLSIYSQIENKDLIHHIEQVGVLFYQRETCPPI